MIRATLILSCGGCDATLEVHGRYVREQTQISAHLLRTAAPRLVIDPDLTDEWVWFDPYTNTQYCPDCWASTMAEPAEAAYRSLPSDSEASEKAADRV